MKRFVTGASGFLGSNLIHELLLHGHEVKALPRPGSGERGLAGAEYERVGGGTSDRAPLEKGMLRCE